jgi:outer membrane protein insertion porin family
MMRTHAWVPAILLVLALEGGAATVSEIKVRREGGGLVEEAAVRGFISVKKGDELSRSALSRDVRALEESGRFSYVATELDEVGDGLVLTYVVKSKPRVRTLRIDGADEIGNRKVRDLLELGAGDPVDDAILAFKSLKVREHYQKELYPYTELEWIIDEDSANGTADVVITVKEGRRASVRAIEFEGGEALSAQSLRKAMKQKRWNIFSWITSHGTYKPDELDADRETIRRRFQDAGYLDARVGEPRLETLDAKRVKVVIPVEQGRQYRLGRVTVAGPQVFPVQEVSGVITSRPRDVASLAAVEQARQSVRDFYGSRGYIGNEVQYKLNPQGGEPVVNLDVSVKEGEKAYIRDIRIRGNTRTKDEVIRRELTVYPGEIYNQVKVRNSERRLRNLGFFDFVNAVPEATLDADRYDVAFEVNEQRVGQFMVGAGFSSVDDLIGFAELSHGNFDLLGWPPVGDGQKLKLRGTAGTKRQDIELSFVEPWFLDRKLSLGVDLFDRDRRFFSDEYEQRNTGGNITLGQPLGTFNRINFTYGLENIDVYNVDTNASDLIKAEEGENLKSSFTVEVVRDTRDNSFVATRGARSSASAMYAGGPLGGDVDIYQLEAQTAAYWPIWFDHVFNLRGWIAVVDSHGSEDRVPLFDRLFLGGARTLRGFKYRKVGPKDEDGEPIGGRSGWYATAEYTMPVVDKLRFATFYDMGMIYDEAYEFETSEYNSDWGVGIRLDFPGFPLRLDYAWPLQADEFNDRSSGRFQFSIGYVF